MVKFLHNRRNLPVLPGGFYSYDYNPNCSRYFSTYLLIYLEKSELYLRLQNALHHSS